VSGTDAQVRRVAQALDAAMAADPVWVRWLQQGIAPAGSEAERRRVVGGALTRLAVAALKAQAGE
jgi:hypothetical protein